VLSVKQGCPEVHLSVVGGSIDHSSTHFEFASSVRDLVERIVKSIVGESSIIRFSTDQDQAADIILNLCMTRQDLAKVIGNEGRTITAIRHIARYMAAKEGRRVYIRLDELEY
jgi:predicted RNA-binding protein YlqC (UPF0109 family)